MRQIREKEFFQRSAFVVAHELIGKFLCHQLSSGEILKGQINEIEIYYGEEDTACHARVGRTKRTETLYQKGGLTYIYLCYGIHELLNIVTGKENHPEAILIRGIKGNVGPGKVTIYLKINRSLHEVDLTTSKELWLEDDEEDYDYSVDKRVGIDYATETYKNINWRYIMKEK